VPPAALSNPAQLGGTTDLMNAEEWTKDMLYESAPEPPNTYLQALINVTIASDIHLTEDGMYRYIAEDGSACGQHFAIKIAGARHWMTTHVMPELKRIDLGRLQMVQAPTLTTEAKVEAARSYRVFYPILGCPATQQHKFFIRKDNLVRHMTGCVDPHMTKAAARVWEEENMELWNQSRQVEYSNCWEAAIWRIHHAS